jgi:hypothetical protein
MAANLVESFFLFFLQEIALQLSTKFAAIKIKTEKFSLLTTAI